MEQAAEQAAATAANSLPALPILTTEQWRALPISERRRLRELKRAHRAAARPPSPNHPPSGPLQGSPDDQPASHSAFLDRHNRPLWLNNTYLGASCFIVLSGPSSREHDLTQLRRRGIYTLAVNNAGTIIRPNAWIFVDPPNKFHDSIWLDPAVTKFVGTRFIDRSLRHKDGCEFKQLRKCDGGEARVFDMPGVVRTIRNAYFEPSRWLTEPSINWGNSKGSARRNHRLRILNVMPAVLKLAYVLGFRAVYLIGCDFTMGSERPYSFATEKDPGAANSNNNSYRTLSVMFEQLKPYFDAAGYHVFNCNPRSGLTVFPFTPYSEAIKAASGHVPQDPLDTVDWYKK